jgi:hypothetical protein
MTTNATVLERAKSNYLLRDIRHLFEPSFEYFVDWSVARAFNGAIVTDGRSTWQVMFYPRNGKHAQPSGLTTDLADMTVATYIKKPSLLYITQKEYDDIVRHSEESFASAANIKSTDMLQQIGRLHLRTMCDSRIAHGEETCKEFIRQLTAEIQGTLLFEPQFEDNWVASDVEPALLRAIESQIPYEAEVELVLPRPEDFVRSHLRSIVPELVGPLQGLGQLVTAQGSETVRGVGISMLHAYSRQF